MRRTDRRLEYKGLKRTKICENKRSDRGLEFKGLERTKISENEKKNDR